MELAIFLVVAGILVWMRLTYVRMATPPQLRQFERLRKMLKQEQSADRERGEGYTELHVARGDFVPGKRGRCIIGEQVQITLELQSVSATRSASLVRYFKRYEDDAGFRVSALVFVKHEEDAASLYRDRYYELQAVVRALGSPSYDELSLDLTRVTLGGRACSGGSLTYTAY